MRKFICIALVCLMAVSLVGCKALFPNDKKNGEATAAEPESVELVLDEEPVEEPEAEPEVEEDIAELPAEEAEAEADVEPEAEGEAIEELPIEESNPAIENAVVEDATEELEAQNV